MKNTLREVRGFRTLIQKIRNYFFKKLNINTLHHAQLWDWKEGAKETLNPFPFMLWTLREIWKDGYSWHGGTWINDPELNPDGVTKDMKINFLSKCYCSWIYVFSHLFSKYGFSWRYGNGLGRWGYTTFKWWTLTYYREHSEWFGGNNHKWKDKKSGYEVSNSSKGLEGLKTGVGVDGDSFPTAITTLPIGVGIEAVLSRKVEPNIQVMNDDHIQQAYNIFKKNIKEYDLSINFNDINHFKKYYGNKIKNGQPHGPIYSFVVLDKNNHVTDWVSIYCSPYKIKGSDELLNVVNLLRLEITKTNVID